MDKTPDHPIEIYTDGACKGNPGPGGWGYVITNGLRTKEKCGGEHDTTNGRMELMAVVKALSALKRPLQASLYADAQFVIKGATEWLQGWKAKGWRKSNGKPVEHIDLWQEIDRFNDLHEIDWQWVKGHAQNELNRRADALANKGVPTTK